MYDVSFANSSLVNKTKTTFLADRQGIEEIERNIPLDCEEFSDQFLLYSASKNMQKNHDEVYDI